MTQTIELDSEGRIQVRIVSPDGKDILIKWNRSARGFYVRGEHSAPKTIATALLIQPAVSNAIYLQPTLLE